MSLITESLEKPRSPLWPKARAKHLELQPHCMLCEGVKKLEVHHIIPFHLHPELELDPNNLITLCENKDDGVNCHLLFGHLGNFQSYNPNCVNNVNEWHAKIRTRP